MARLTEPPGVRRIPILDGAACARIEERLDGVRPHWIRRGESFFTLGAAAYLDACGGDGTDVRYRERLADGNATIRETFGDLLEAVRSALENETATPCAFTGDFALPGFHIFLAKSLNARMRDHLHLDLQYTYLPFAGAELGTETLTYTLPLALPRAGAGIEFCEASRADPRGSVRVEPYLLGELLVHSGRTLHRRAHFPSSEQCRRITLQGHALRVDGRWVLYW